MKRTTTLTAIVFALLSPLALADYFETLAGYRDTITVPAGRAALILFVTDTPTVQYQKKGKRPVQFQLGLTRPSEVHHNHGRSAYAARVERNPSANQPLALAGPATVSLMTDGVVSVQVIDSKAGK